MDVSVLIGLAVCRIIECSVCVVSLMTLGSEADVHLCRTKRLIDLLQVSRGCRGLVAYFEGIAGFELIEREGAERKGYTEGFGRSISAGCTLNCTVRKKIFLFVFLTEDLKDRRIDRLYKAYILDAVLSTTLFAEHDDGRCFAVLVGAHDIVTGCLDGDAELVHARFERTGVRSGHLTIDIGYDESHLRGIHHRQIDIGRTVERVRVILRKQKTLAGNELFHVKHMLQVLRTHGDARQRQQQESTDFFHKKQICLSVNFK